MSIIAGLATLAGAGIGLLGNQKAASASKHASDNAASAIRESTASAREIYDQNAARYDQQYAAGKPGIDYLSGQLSKTRGDDLSLTPFQKQQLADSRRSTEQSLAGSGLRGSGRARVSALRAVESGVKGGMLEANRGRADRLGEALEGRKQAAAGALTSGAFNANQGAANAGSQTAAALLSEGRSLAGIEGNQGQVAANRGISDASIVANTVGDLAGTFDPGLRKSRYNAGQTASAIRGYYAGQ